MTKEQLQDKCRGSLVGGAVGDAFGYPVELVNTFEAILLKCGEEDVTQYDKSYPWLEENVQNFTNLFLIVGKKQNHGYLLD